MKYKILILSETNEPTNSLGNKINSLCELNHLKLVSTYENKILGDWFLYGIFEELS